MKDWGLAVMAFAAITGGITWVVYFGYELFMLEPPGLDNRTKKDHKPEHRKAA